MNLERELKNYRILITGASGWIGQELLCLIQGECGTLRGLRLTCGARVSRNINIHDEIVELKSLSSIDESDEFDLIIHLAFLLPNSSSQLPIKDVEEINSAIQSKVKRIFLSNPSALKLIFSSGAVDSPNKMNESEIMLSYSSQKKVMENQLVDSNSLVIRLWSASGHHIPIKSNYALGEFINSAKVNKDIIIRRNVKRSFVSIQELLHASIEFLLDGGRGVINSGGTTVTLFQLATIVVEELNSQSRIVVENMFSEVDSDYCSPLTEFPQTYSKNFSLMREQIYKTIHGLYLR